MNRAPAPPVTMVTLTSAVLILLTVVKRSGATCNAEQKNRCRQSAEENQLESVPGSGQCIVKQYVQYTHVCTVSNYVPNIDYCCCSHRPAQVMCCRYHQDWNHFRCVESDDRISTSSQVVDITGSWQPLLLTSVAVVFVGGCLLLCCMSCMCRQCRRHRYEYNDDPGKYSTLYSCCDEGTSSPFDEVGENKSAAVNASSYLVDPARHQTTALIPTSCPVYRHHRHPHDQLNCYVDRPPPSAPPSSSLTCTPDDDRFMSQTSITRSPWQPPLHTSGQSYSDVIVCVNENDGRPRCSTCAITSFPPPTYDESLYHCPSATIDSCRRSAAYRSMAQTNVMTLSQSLLKDEMI